MLESNQRLQQMEHAPNLDFYDSSKTHTCSNQTKNSHRINNYTKVDKGYTSYAIDLENLNDSVLKLSRKASPHCTQKTAG